MALALDPMCVKALYRRGTALAMMGRWADSVKGEPSFPLPSLAHEPVLISLSLSYTL